MISGTAALVAAGIAAAGAVGSAVASGVSSSKQLNRSLSRQDRINEQNRQWQIEDRDMSMDFSREMFDKQNQWNSIAHQRQMYEESGYKYMPNGNIDAASPMAASFNTAQGQSGFDSGLAQQASSAAGSVVAAIGNFGVNAVQAMNGMLDSQANISLKQSQTAVNYANEQLAQETTAKVFQETTGMRLDNLVKNATTKDQIAIIQNTAKKTSFEVGKAQAEAKMLEIQAADYPEMWDYIKKQAKANANSAEAKARFDAVEAEIAELYGKDEAKTRLDSLKVKYNEMVQELRGMTYFNSDKWLEKQTEYLQECINLYAGEAGIANQRANAKIKYKGEDGEWHTARAIDYQTGNEAVKSAAEAGIVTTENNVSKLTAEGRVYGTNFDNNAFNKGLTLFSKSVGQLGVGSNGMLQYRAMKNRQAYDKQRWNTRVNVGEAYGGNPIDDFMGR